MAENTTSLQDRAPKQTENAPQQALWQMITGCFVSQAVFTAAKLGIADLLKDGPRHPAVLAEATATHAPSLYRLLRALASIGVFIEDEQGRFGLTPVAELLRTDAPGSLRAVALLTGSPLEWGAWGDLLYSVQSGASAVPHVFGVELWEYIARHPETNDIFHQAMSNISATELRAILSAYDFSAIHTLVDIAGGHGKLLFTILQAYPQMHGILFDLPTVIERAEEQLKATGVAQRCTLVRGDMFASVPTGGDAYIMKSVIHDWDDEQAVALLRVCRTAMPAHAKLLLISRILAPANVADPGKFMDLNMLVALGGRERTTAEFEALLDAADLALSRIIPTRSPMSILECTKR
jgi:hypothetical protein